MEISNDTTKKYLEQNKYATNYINILAIKDEAEDYDLEDYDTLDDLMSDVIGNLDGTLIKTETGA